jgi:hypothetical protein
LLHLISWDTSAVLGIGESIRLTDAVEYNPALELEAPIARPWGHNWW